METFHSTHVLLTREQLAEIGRLSNEFESAWQIGITPRLETFLEQVAPEARGTLFCELIRIEAHHRGKELDEAEIQRRISQFSTASDTHSAGKRRSLTSVVPDPALTRTFICLDCNGKPRAANVGESSIGPGVTISDRYRIDREIGRGGMGRVYLALDLRLERPVAIKVIRVEKSSTPGEADTLQSADFEREAKIGAVLMHPAIATLHDYGFHGDMAYIVSEYIAGASLRDLIQRKAPMPIEDVRLIIVSIAQALDYAHSRGIVHRDLKPENLRFTEQRQPKILDLGLALRFQEHTQWGFAGTPAYASPEQASEKPSDGRADQYALAIITYEMLTGRRPFLTNNWQVVLAMHRNETAMSSRVLNSHIPAEVDAALLRGLEKDPNQRFSSCGDFAAAIGCRFISGTPRSISVIQQVDIQIRECSWLLGSLRRLKLIVPAFAHFYELYRWLTQSPGSLLLVETGLWITQQSKLIEFWPTFTVLEVTLHRENIVTFRLRRGAVTRSYEIAFKDAEEAFTWRTILEESLLTSTEEGAIGLNSLTEHVEPLPERRWAVPLSMKPETAYQIMEVAESRGESKSTSIWNLQTLATLREADAVVDIRCEFAASPNWNYWRSQGILIKAVDSQCQNELLWVWFGTAIRAIVRLKLALMLFCVGGMVVCVSAMQVFGPGTIVLFGVVYCAFVAGWPLSLSYSLVQKRDPRLLLATKLSVVGLMLAAHSLLFASLLALDSIQTRADHMLSTDDSIDAFGILRRFKSIAIFGLVAWIVGAYWLPWKIFRQVSATTQLLRSGSASDGLAQCGSGITAATAMSIAYIVMMAAGTCAWIYPGFPW